MLVIALACVAALLGIACVAVVIARSRFANLIVYDACLIISVVGLGCGLAGLLAAANCRRPR